MFWWYYCSERDQMFIRGRRFLYWQNSSTCLAISVQLANHMLHTVVIFSLLSEMLAFKHQAPCWTLRILLLQRPSREEQTVLMRLNIEEAMFVVYRVQTVMTLSLALGSCWGQEGEYHWLATILDGWNKNNTESLKKNKMAAESPSPLYGEFK